MVSSRGVWIPSTESVSSVVVNNLSQLKDVGIAHIYCQYQQIGIQTTEALLGAIAKQLLQQHPKLIKYAKQCHSQWKHEDIPRLKPILCYSPVSHKVI